MARKAYSEEDRVQVRNALMTTMIQCIADRGLIHSSIDVLCRKVGISKTFFYSFFSSKEELVLYALRYQQPKLLDYARSLMEDPGLSWRAGVETFLKNCCYGAKSGVAVLSIEEEQQVRHCLSEENFQAFRRDQIIFYGKLLSIFSLPVDSIDPRLFGNLALSMMMVHKAIPDTMPFLFPPECTDFWQLLGYRDAITPEIQRAALAAGVFWPCEIYYHAPADVGEGLIHALLSTEDSSEASNLMCCLAFQGDGRALETLLELENHPRSWRKKLYVDPSIYAQCGGWTFNKKGQRTQLNFDTCFSFVKGAPGEVSPVRIGRAREDTCPHCGGRMADMLVLDGRDERLKFLGLDGILTATCCPNCVGFLKGPAFNRFTLDGGVEVFPSELFDGAGKMDCYVRPEDYRSLTENPFVLGGAPVPLFYGAACDDVNTVGGFANWVQDWEYTACPHCGKPMKYLAQIQWDTLMDGTEGTLYIEFCPDCQIVSMQHQQT